MAPRHVRVMDGDMLPASLLPWPEPKPLSGGSGMVALLKYSDDDRVVLG